MLQSIYPVLMVKNIEEMRSFYVKCMKMEITFNSDWYISLKKEGISGVFQLALLRFDHPTIPEGFRSVSKDLLINFEVESADELYKDLIGEHKQPLHLDIKDEEWGQRHFITSDPEGNLLDIIQLIEPNEQFLAQYADGLQ